MLEVWGGYRNIWHALRLRYGIHVSRYNVSRLMTEIDLLGVEERKRDVYTEEFIEVKDPMLAGTLMVISRAAKRGGGNLPCQNSSRVPLEIRVAITVINPSLELHFRFAIS